MLDDGAASEVVSDETKQQQRANSSTVGSHDELIILEEQRAESDRLFLAMRNMEVPGERGAHGELARIENQWLHHVRCTLTEATA
jgi:hypothetical protein